MSSLEAAFDDAPPLQLLSRVTHAFQNESIAPLFNDISTYIVGLKHEIRDLKRKLDDQSTAAEEPAAKKRKLPVGAPQHVTPVNNAWHLSKATFEVADISFSIPLRKKLSLEIVSNDDAAQGGVRISAPSVAEQGVAIAWNDIEQVICVPVPEKAQKAYQFIVIPQSSPAASYNPDSLMWTISSTPPKDNQVTLRDPSTGAETHPANQDLTLDLLTLQTLNTNLQKFGKSITLPSPQEFTSALVQPHLKNQTEKAYHVKAFRGSKDGYLYFLPTGIVFTPRKPLLFFPFSKITSISYSSVLQRTFNLNICARVAPSGATTGDGAAVAGELEPEAEFEFEFAMLDQADFAGIDAYVRRHGLHDASLAESRRAKVYNVNASKGAASAGVNGGANGVPAAEGDDEGEGRGVGHENGGESELAKAERELQDAEDEEEEDYDPSGGESEGSGSESGDEDGEPGRFAEEEVEAGEGGEDIELEGGGDGYDEEDDG